MNILLALLACSGPPTADDFRLRAQLSSELSTVVNVRWDSDLDVSGAVLHVENGLGEAWEMDIGGGAATVWGLPPDESVDLEITFDVDGVDIVSDAVSLETGSVDSALPGLDITGDEVRALGGSLMVTTTLGTPNSPVIVDGAGRIRWWATGASGAELSRARVSADGQHVLALPVNVDGRDVTGLMRFARDGTLVDSVQVVSQHHDFVEHSDGTLAFLVHSERAVDGTLAKADKIVEVAPDGTETEIWDAWDTITYDDNASGSSGEGWTHANALVFDEANQTYAVSLLGIRATAQIDRASGDMLWLMGTADSDFEQENGSTTIVDRGHQFEFLDGSILFFENGEPAEQSSRAVQYSYDPSDPVMRLEWSYTPDPHLYTFSLGDVKRLDNGDTVVVFSANGSMVQADAEGSEIWRMDASLGTAFGYIELLGPPGSF